MKTGKCEYCCQVVDTILSSLFNLFLVLLHSDDACHHGDLLLHLLAGNLPVSTKSSHRTHGRLKHSPCHQMAMGSKLNARGEESYWKWHHV